MDNKLSQGLAHRFNLAAKGICLNTNHQQRSCKCSLKDLCNSGDQRRDECQKQLLNFISLVRKWKKKDHQSYTDYVFRQYSLKQKGNYRKGEEDKYFIPDAEAQSFTPPPDDEELNEMPPKMPTLCKEGWICLGFWCFLLGVDKNGVSALRERESEIDAFVRELRNEDAPSDLETWIESGVM
jgi:hypothetical protein